MQGAVRSVREMDPAEPDPGLCQDWRFTIKRPGARDPVDILRGYHRRRNTQISGVPETIGPIVPPTTNNTSGRTRDSERSLDHNPAGVGVPLTDSCTTKNGPETVRPGSCWRRSCDSHCENYRVWHLDAFQVEKGVTLSHLRTKSSPTT
jgi:hypothetical protein